MGNKRETRDAGREKENEHKASMDEDELLNKVEASALAPCQLHLNTKETANTKNTKKKSYYYENYSHNAVQHNLHIILSKTILYRPKVS